ncbi:MAG TPA: glycosyltransferase family 2 protein, partial [Phycisphaerae bacterium]
MPIRLVREGLAWLLDLSWFDVVLKTGLMGLYVGIIALAWHTGALFNNFNELYETRMGAMLMTGGALYSAFMLMVTLGRVLMVMRYKPMVSLSDGELPSVTVIVPAYNEGPDVAKTIDSIARSHYPRTKLQIIAIDDGSKDNTWHHMEMAAKRHPDIVCAIRMDKNGGKRQGLRVGFALAAGDVLVTLDSDCVVERDALRSLVTPIAKDPRIGAVAGNVKVLNRDAGILPRMMRASFVIAFDFTRAYQSKIGAVLCTPGAFSAYRRSAVEAVLNDWNNQSFCGKPSTIAEDRALTNLILREGHEIVFQSDAVVWTNVPTTYKQMARMYQRWERGNVRENLTYGTFCWKPFRKRYRAAANV